VKVAAGSVGFLIAAQARLAQRKVTLRQRNLVWRNVGLFGATLVGFAPTRPCLTQGRVAWRKVPFFGATQSLVGAKWAYLAQRLLTLRQRT
jgi:hypothetical protein